MSTQHAQPDSSTAASPGLYGVLAQYPDVEHLLAAARKVREAGYTRWDVHSPFPVHRMEQAMGLGSTRLPWITLILGLSGTATALLLVWWTNAVSLPVPAWVRGYTYVISGKPLFSLPANIPVVFELTVLFAATATLVGMLLLNRLPRLYNPLFKSHLFRRATSDRFFISVLASDPVFERNRTTELLRSLGALAIEELED